VATYWVSTLGNDTTGNSLANAKITIAGGLALLGAKGDILNIVNDGVYDWPTAVTSKNTGRGTNWTDFGYTIRGVTGATEAPGMVTIKPTADLSTNRHFIKITATGNTEATAAGFVIFQNLIFDATLLAVGTIAYIHEGTENTSGYHGPMKFQYCAFLNRVSGAATAPTASIRQWIDSDYTSRYGGHELEYCYLQNLGQGFDRLSSYSNTYNNTAKVDHCVSIWDIAAAANGIQFTIGLRGGSNVSDVVTVTHNTVYVEVGSAVGTGRIVHYQPAASSNVGTFDAHSNLLWVESTKVVSCISAFLASSAASTSVTHAGTIGYNVLVGGPSIVLADLLPQGWYEKCWDPNNADVNGEDDSYPTDHVLWQQAKTNVFYAPSSTYDWVMPNGLVITICKDLRPIVFQTSGYNGETPGALPPAYSNYRVTVAANPTSVSAKQRLAFMASFSNVGADSTGVQVTAVLPTGVTYLEHTASQGTYNPYTSLWNIGAVADGGSASLSVTVRVNDDQAGETLVFTATLTASSPDSGGDLTDDTDSVSVPVGDPLARYNARLARATVTTEQTQKAWLLQNTEDTNLFGLGNMDIVYDSGGRLVGLEGKEKLQFLILKCVLTGRYLVEGIGSYGSTVPRLVGQKIQGSNNLADSMYSMAVDRAIENFRVNQPTDLADSERLLKIDGDFQVSRDRKDRTILLVGASVRNAKGELIPVVHSFKAY